MRVGALLFVGALLIGCDGNLSGPSIEDPDHRIAILLASIDVPSNCVLDQGNCTLEKSLLGTEISVNNYSHENTYHTEGKYFSETEWRSKAQFSYSFESPTDGSEITGSIDWDALNYLDQNPGYTLLSQGCYYRNYSRTDSSNSSALVTLKRPGAPLKHFEGEIRYDSIYPHEESFCQSFPASQFPESGYSDAAIDPNSNCFLSTKKCWDDYTSRNQNEIFGLYYWNRSPAFFYGNLPPLFIEFLFPNDTNETYPRLEFHTGKRQIVFKSNDPTHDKIELKYESTIHPSTEQVFSNETVHDLFNRKVSYKTDLVDQSINLTGNNQILISVFNNEVDRQQFPYQSLYANNSVKNEKHLTLSEAINQDLTGSSLLDHSIESVINNLPKLNFIDPGVFHKSGTTNEIDAVSVCQLEPCSLNDYIAVQIDSSELNSNFSDWESLLQRPYSYEEMVTEQYVYNSDPEFLHYDGTIEFLDIEGNRLLLEIDTLENIGSFELFNKNAELVDSGSLLISISDTGVLCESGIHIANEYRYDSPGPRHSCKNYYQFTKVSFALK